ncbi:MAG: hypothetical protein IJN39_01560 [Clostridia bacterium]|nr:hypothetical protein [Clostridia bacterium]
MFWFEKEKICFENGKSEYVNKWLCDKSKDVTKMLKSGVPSPCDGISCAVKDGKILYDAASDTEIASVAFSYAKNYGIDILLCTICGAPFAPIKRNDEKYCLACRKTGASKTFRQKNSQDENYTLFLQHTKHLRYLKSKLKISDAAFTRSYAEAKAALDALRKGEISSDDFKIAMGKAPEIQGQKTIESYLL